MTDKNNQTLNGKSVIRYFVNSIVIRQQLDNTKGTKVLMSALYDYFMIYTKHVDISAQYTFVVLSSFCLNKK